MPAVLGEQIQSAFLAWERTLAEPGVDELYARLPGQSVRDVTRRGKFLQLILDRDVLLFHLRMSGDLIVKSASLPPAAHDRFWLHFRSGRRLAFNDPRKFGRVWLVADPQVVVGGLGPEPLDPALTLADFSNALHARHRQIKPLLLDQSFLAGLGNIYTDEALYRARIHPLRLADSLSEEEIARLLPAIREVLEEGIRRQGASIDWVYRGGDFQNAFRVYQQTGKPCPTCGTPIQRTVIGQRGTHFCPVCQPFE